MASNLYIKSTIWLVSLGGLGYGLLRLTEPSEEKLQRIRNSSLRTNLSADEKRNALFFQKIKEAAGYSPSPSPSPSVYIKKKEED